VFSILQRQRGGLFRRKIQRRSAGIRQPPLFAQRVCKVRRQEPPSLIEGRRRSGSRRRPRNRVLYV
jgi:hypothetical protein